MSFFKAWSWIRLSVKGTSVVHFLYLIDKEWNFWGHITIFYLFYFNIIASCLNMTKIILLYCLWTFGPAPPLYRYNFAKCAHSTFFGLNINTRSIMMARRSVNLTWLFRSSLDRCLTTITLIHWMKIDNVLF